MSRTLQKIARWIHENRSTETSPVLFYDLDLIRERMSALRSLGETHGASFVMAVKSFPHPEVLSEAAIHLAGFDVSNAFELNMISGRDVELVIATGPKLQFPLNFTGNAQPLLFLENSDQLRAMIESQSVGEFGLRLDWTQMETTSNRSRFGFTWPDAMEALSSISPELKERFVGFHCHRGAGVNQIDDYVRIARWIYDHASWAGIRLKYLDLGGGQGDLTLQDFNTLMGRIREFLPSDTKLIFEPGRFLSGSAGYAMGTVLSIAMRDDQSLVALDLSKECHLRWSRPRLIHSSGGSVEKRPVRFDGPTCFESDTFGSFLLDVNQVKVGDRVLFGNVSGYCFAWNTSFNGCPPAKTVIL